MSWNISVLAVENADPLLIVHGIPQSLAGLENRVSALDVAEGILQ
jgi:hypothetical protein